MLVMVLYHYLRWLSAIPKLRHPAVNLFTSMVSEEQQQQTVTRW